MLTTACCLWKQPDKAGRRPVHGNVDKSARDPSWRQLSLFYEYFNSETGQGAEASHQTVWTALVTRCSEELEKVEPIDCRRQSVSLRTNGHG